MRNITERAIGQGKLWDRKWTGRAIGQDENKRTLKQGFEIQDKGKVVH